MNNMSQHNHPLHYNGFESRTWIPVLFCAFALALVGYAVYLLGKFAPFFMYMGLALIGGGVILFFCSVAIPVIYVFNLATKMHWYDIGEFGSFSKSMFGRSTMYAPMTPNAVKVQKLKKRIEVMQEVPTIIELISSGVIALGQLAMHMGYERTKGGLVPVIDGWPGSFIIAGQGRSGKTRRVLTIIFQALIGQARVIICDPHANKPDGLAKLLEPLAPWLTIARGIEQILEVTRTFHNEMEGRVEGNGNSQPWLIIYDEWSRLMTTDKVDDEDREDIKQVVRLCSREYAGFHGYAGIIGQSWTVEEAGGTDIRRLAHKIFIHKINSEYANFFVKGRWANKCEELSVRECLYSEDNQKKVIVTLGVPDDAAEWFADWLMQNLPPDQLGTAPQLQRINAPGPRQLAQKVSPGENENTEIELKSKIVDSETVKVVNEPVEPSENNENVTAQSESYTDEEKMQVIRAVAELSAEGKKVTRDAIRLHLGWHKKYHTRVIKPVCDQYNIA